MKKSVILVGLVSLILMGCAGGSSISSNSDNALSANQLKEKLINGEIYRDTEAFYFLENNIFVYKDKETNKEEYGSWQIRKVFNPSKNVYVDSICFDSSSADEYDPSSRRGICMRLYPKSDKYDNLYLGIFVRCHDISLENPICKVSDKLFGHYRIKKTKRTK